MRLLLHGQKKMFKHNLQYQPNVEMLTFLLTSWSRICCLPVFVIVYIFAGGCDQTLSSTFCTLLINLRSCGKKQKSCSPFIILVGFLTVLRKGQLQLQICAQITIFFGYLSSPRAKRAGPKGPRAESARAVTGRRNSHSGRGEDFLTGQLNL